MKRDSASPEHYIASLEGWQKELLLQIRSLIQEVAPEAKEGIDAFFAKRKPNWV